MEHYWEQNPILVRDLKRVAPGVRWDAGFFHEHWIAMATFPDGVKRSFCPPWWGEEVFRVSVTRFVLAWLEKQPYVSPKKRKRK